MQGQTDNYNVKLISFAVTQPTEYEQSETPLR